MKAGDLSTFLARIDAAEYGLCRRLNSGAANSSLRRLFRIVSRLGDGIAWYVLIVALPLIYGRGAVRPAVAMAVTGIAGVALYKALKRTFVRKRPFVTYPGIDCAAAPLDFYSFPSGHTLHAVSFTWQAVAHFGDLAWMLVPFTCLIAASRVVLGLHYPSDVVVGAVLGALLAAVGLSFS
ncbi:MAG TPA: phosphatase PAP2 family protein [Steroidobacteraceae bacterium]|nr:phosphatase PAP2 family protein [Steroidobacteraceae bacterium]